jgi:cysteinyl-tRNA synthetase
MERRLPDETLIIGVDEHTAALVDIPAGTVQVVGVGGLTLRKGGESRFFPTGTILELSTLSDAAEAATAPPVPVQQTPKGEPEDAHSLREAADALDARFAAALEANNGSDCAAAVLELETAIEDWSADTLTGPDHEYARGLLRGMIVRMGQLADEAHEAVPALVAAVHTIREQARTNRDFAMADSLRDALTTAGFTIADAKIS